MKAFKPANVWKVTGASLIGLGLALTGCSEHGKDRGDQNNATGPIGLSPGGPGGTSPTSGGGTGSTTNGGPAGTGTSGAGGANAPK
jgi:hypothetical protein